MITREQLASMFDHTNLKAFSVDADFEQLCQEAIENRFGAVCVNCAPAAFCKELLKGTDIDLCVTIGFPLGQMTVEGKAFEAQNAIDNGANEIDYVLNVGQLRQGNLEYIRKEMETIVNLCRRQNVISKVIFENCYLTKEQIRAAAEIAREVKPDFIKTSTGFGTGGAAAEDVRLMKETVGPEVKVKAAGGIRDLETCLAMIEAGAERIGVSSSLKILAEYDRRYQA